MASLTLDIKGGPVDLQITTEPLGLLGILSSFQLLGLPYLVDQTSVLTLPMDYSLHACSTFSLMGQNIWCVKIIFQQIINEINEMVLIL